MLGSRTRVAMSLLALCILPIDFNARGDERPAIIPQPAEMKVSPGEFQLSASTIVRVGDGARGTREAAEYLAEILRARTGFELPVFDVSQARGPIILLNSGADSAIGAEGYHLRVSRSEVRLSASQTPGLFRAVQTLRQLLPPEFEKRGARAGKGRKTWAIPCVEINDAPRYRWRGMLLDCGRHFMDKEFIKRYIDLLAYHKLNVLHWHLTEDQGWRIEIRKYPRLTEVGAWRKATRESEQPRSNGRYGGFYSQEDIKEIVAYAKSRYVTVVPEIEMPGHSVAALAAYPELSCSGGPFEVSTVWGPKKDVYCAGNEKTFEFLQNVLSEVCELFPSEFIHIGGDEVPRDRWKSCAKCQARMRSEGLKDENELQGYFIRRIEKFLNSKQRRLIGWDEILEGGLAPNATVQSWRGMKGAVAAATTGHDVISSPTSHCYLDYPHYKSDPGYPSWMGAVSLEKTYSFEPTPAVLTAAQARHILGAEGNLWTEHAPQPLIDRQAFPRLCALAEVTWSPKEDRDWADFQRRMKTHYKRLDALGVKYHHKP